MALPPARVCIVILNWNGWRDTVECLDSLHSLQHPNAFVVLVDNASTDDSRQRITTWAERSQVSLAEISHDGASSNPPSIPLDQPTRSAWLCLVRSAQNLGFAAGCNLGMKVGLQLGCEYVWLLNNDTVVAPDCLGKLADFLDEHSDYAGVTGQIRLHQSPGTIWNCGGELLPLGLRRYHYDGAPAYSVPQQGFARITFMTGCAPLFRASVMWDSGFLSEKFFFGEEDFELCHRFKRRHLYLACRYDALIYHKVSASVSVAAGQRSLAKIHVYYLNRFIHMRTYWSPSAWQCWRHAYCLYIVWLMLRNRQSTWSAVLKMLSAVLRESQSLDGVDRTTFTQLMSGTVC